MTGAPVRGAHPTSIELSFPAKADYLILARLALSGLARSSRIGDDLLADLKLAVTEACGNAVRHAYAGDADVVKVRYELEGDEIVVCVEDRGGGVQPEDVTPDAADPLVEGGMGMAIMRAIMDDVRVEAGHGGVGTQVVMRKRLA